MNTDLNQEQIGHMKRALQSAEDAGKSYHFLVGWMKSWIKASEPKPLGYETGRKAAGKLFKPVYAPGEEDPDAAYDRTREDRGVGETIIQTTIERRFPHEEAKRDQDRTVD